MQLTMSEVNKIKDKEQKKAVNAWAKNNFKGSIIAGTGFGKSRCGVIAVGETLRRLEPSINKPAGLVLVPTVNLRDQFKEEFIKWGYEDVLEFVEFMCYQTAYKLTGHHYDVVVCDEVHLGLSPKYRKFFKNNIYDRLLCMTATLPEEPEYKVKLHQLAPTVYKITLDECVDLGLVAHYEIVCVPVSLTEEEKKEYKKINSRFVYWKYHLGPFNAFDEAKRIMGDKNATSAEKQASHQFYKSIRDRKAIVDSAENKIEEVKKIVIKNLDTKMLAFSGSNAFTDRICASNEPLAVTYHSGKTKKKREEALKSFREEDSIQLLCSTKALNQGLDVPDASVGIICGLTSKALSMIQRVGRLIRFQEDKEGKIYVLYVKDSQEEKWLKSSVKNLKNITWL